MNEILYTDQDDQFTSHWPLPETGVRHVTPHLLAQELALHPISEDLYPLALGYYPNAQGHAMLRRTHNNYLLIYCTAGSGRLTLKKERRDIHPGDLILLSPGQAHSYRANPVSPWSIFWIHFDGRLSQTYTELIASNSPVKPIGVNSHLVQSFDHLINKRRRSLNITHHLHQANQLKTLLTDISGVTEVGEQGNGINPAIAKVLLHMQQHLAGELDLDELATIANLSKYHFIRAFRASTGYTPIQHLIHLRMETACQRLDQSAKAIKHIAAELGYNDPLYFSRQFKKVMGLSPQDYRKLHSA